MKIDEERAVLQNGDANAASELARGSISALEAGIQLAKQQLERWDARPESRARWGLELRARREELARRQARLGELTSARIVRMSSSTPAAPYRSIYLFDDDGVNNVWYIDNAAADTVFVFVHGILSNSKTCWLNDDDPLHLMFWPDLVASDARFSNPAIFLGGFYTAIDSGRYDVLDAQRELHDAMHRQDEHGRRPVMDFSNIIFICHSTGGLVARYLLTRYTSEFAQKNVGLVLIASPSWGSYLADKVRFLTQLYKQRLGRQLEWGNDVIRQLDDDFRSLLAKKEIPNLAGVEAFENHFVIHDKWIPFLTKTIVVDEGSAVRYFDESRQLRATTHFSSVKPESVRHPAHELLIDFYTRKFLPMVRANG
ncbi:MAG TPA: alpha/beta fold hydrolase [Gemmatimonadaceae bacterium]|jgi:pimeloyl-ACP methyl ester carboxylesterase